MDNKKKIAPAPAAAKRPTYSTLTGWELWHQPAPRKWLIEGWIGAESLVMFYGQSGCGKTFAVLDMALTIADSRLDAWCGCGVEHGPIIYFAGEDWYGVQARMAAWAKYHGWPDGEEPDVCLADVCLITDKFRLNAHGSVDTVRATLEANGFVRKGEEGKHPALFVFDTLNCFMKGDENSAQDAANFIDACNTLKSEYGAAVMIVANDDLPEQGSSGSNFLVEYCDTIIHVKRKNKKNIILTQKKQRNAKERPPLELTFKGVTIPEWPDKYGKPTTSLVLEYLRDNQPRDEDTRTDARGRKRSDCDV